MNHTQNRPTAMNSPTDPLIQSQVYNPITRQYDKRTAYIGDQVEVRFCYGGTVMDLPDGRRGVMQSRYSRFVLVRMDDTGIVDRVPATELVTLVDRVSGYGLPPVGAVVEVLRGERTGEVGLVVSPGVNSTHVLFAYGSGDTNAKSNTRQGAHMIKYPAKNLRVLDGTIVPS